MGCLLLLLVLLGFGAFTGQRISPGETSLAPTRAAPVYVDGGVTIMRFAVAHDADADGCPVDETTSFRRSETVNVFAIGAYPRDTEVFARMYYDGVPTEDTDLLTADRSYDDVCVYFIFEPTTAAEVFDRGPYRVEFFVNGVSAGSVGFVIE
jgi:hypothetical protein